MRTQKMERREGCRRKEERIKKIRIYSVTIQLHRGMYLNSMKFKQKTFWRKKEILGLQKKSNACISKTTSS